MAEVFERVVSWESSNLIDSIRGLVEIWYASRSWLLRTARPRAGAAGRFIDRMSAAGRQLAGIGDTHRFGVRRSTRSAPARVVSDRAFAGSGVTAWPRAWRPGHTNPFDRESPNQEESFVPGKHLATRLDFINKIDFLM